MRGKNYIIISANIAFVFWTNITANAGWFGPSTYDDCVLDGMKGRPRYMIDTVNSSCRSKFCSYREETDYEKQVDAEYAAKCQADGGIESTKGGNGILPNFKTSCLKFT